MEWVVGMMRDGDDNKRDGDEKAVDGKKAYWHLVSATLYPTIL